MVMIPVHPFSALVIGLLCLGIGVPMVYVNLFIDDNWLLAAMGGLVVLVGVGCIAGCVSMRRAGRGWFQN